MKEDLEFEDELAKSIANIVDEETSEAEAYVNSSLENESNAETPDKEELNNAEIVYDENEYKGGNKKKIIIIVASILASLLLIGGIAYFIIISALNKTRDNYAYYNNLGYEALDNDEYSKAVTNFEKALTYKEGKNASDENINMMLHLYDCYVALKLDDKAEQILNDIHNLDKNNYYALYYLVNSYDKEEKYDKISELYDEQKDNSDDKIKALFSKYSPVEPEINPAEGKFGSNQNISIYASGCKIYYTSDGKDPIKYGTLYENSIAIKEGDTTIKYYSVNEYGIKSDVYTAKYTISYDVPNAPTLSPKSGTYSTTTEQLIAIGNIPIGGKAYYTTDGSVPNTGSNLYSVPFAMPEGSSVISVIVVDKNGLTSSVATATYKLEITDKYSSDDAKDLIWKKLIAKGIVNDKHLDADENEFNILYYSKRTIKNITIWMYNVRIGSELEEYYYGVDAATGDVYEIKDNNGSYVLTKL